MPSLIVAMSTNRVIGREGQLPWKLSRDLRRFKQLTWGHTIIMGRKTFESIGRLLPGRTTVIVSRQPDYRVEGAQVVDGLEAALELAEPDTQPFIVGGAEIYAQSLPWIHRLYLTRVHTILDGDTIFPEIDLATWTLLEQTWCAKGSKDAFDSTFQVYQRKLTSGTQTGTNKQ